MLALQLSTLWMFNKLNLYFYIQKAKGVSNLIDTFVIEKENHMGHEPNSRGLVRMALWPRDGIEPVTAQRTHFS